MNLPQSSQLNIGYFSRLFDNTTNCYKFFWFKGILKNLEAGKTQLSFDEILNEMIVDAWYMVTAYHLQLGPNGIKDNLEEVVKYIYEKEEFIPSDSREKILAYLNGTNDKEILRYKKELIKNVPYRLQVPFYGNGIDRKTWYGKPEVLAKEINSNDRLMYYFVMMNGIESIIEMDSAWAEYLLRNIEIIRGWLELNLIHYLQKRNPSVPGIADKLSAPQERKLDKAKKYWKSIIDVTEIRNIYSGELMTTSDISIDHFVPWSYVAHDELWNLVPTTRTINSSKSNNLPDWDLYFQDLASVEYSAYRAVREYDEIKALQKAANDCLKEHVNNDEIRYSLYQSELDQTRFAEHLEKILRPSYDSALNMGFRVWNYENTR